jgi:hypothetical protein
MKTRVEYEWLAKDERGARCPCCRKKTEIVLDVFLHMTAKGWDNQMPRERSERLAKEGTCPWCGRRTTTPKGILLGRFEPTQREYDRGFLSYS